jgi:hypothetical protein
LTRLMWRLSTTSQQRYGSWSFRTRMGIMAGVRPGGGECRAQL